MAPQKQAKIASSPVTSAGGLSESQSYNASQSQDLEMARLQEAGSENRRKTKERQDQQKKEILSNHEKRQNDLKRDIEQCLSKYDERVRVIRRPKIQRLLELACEKRALEERIEKCQSELDKAFFRTAAQLQTSLDCRIEELSE